MDCKKLLNNYHEFPIMLDNNLAWLFPNYKNMGLLPSSIRVLLSALDVDYYNQSILYIYFNEYGFYFDFSRLKRKMMEYFNILDEDKIVDELLGIKARIESGKITKPNLSRLMSQRFNKDYLEAYENYVQARPPIGQKWKYSSRQKYYEKEKKIRPSEEKKALNRIKNEVNAFIHICENEENIIPKVSFNERKLNLYFAYEIVYKHAKRCETKGFDSKYREKYKEALKYLIEYIDREKGLYYNLEDGLIKSRFLELEKYVNDRRKKDIKKDVSNKHRGLNHPVKIKDLNCYFFVCEGIMSKDLFDDICKKCVQEDNSIELIEKLLRKERYYNSLNYNTLLIGKEAFSGYIGFKLDSGIIILDKLFENINKGIIAKEGAIFVVQDEDEFEKIIKLSRTQARVAIDSGIITGGRIIHQGCYEDKVNNYIDENEKKKIKQK